jgi:hypothetical protein
LERRESEEKGERRTELEPVNDDPFYTFLKTPRPSERRHHESEEDNGQ